MYRCDSICYRILHCSILGTKLVIQAGYRLKKDPLFRSRIDVETEIGQYLDQEIQTVPPLMRQCRAVIRQKLGTTFVRTKVKCLPLPLLMVKYLDLNDLVDLIPEDETSDKDINDFVMTPEIDLGDISNETGA